MGSHLSTSSRRRAAALAVALLALGTWAGCSDDDASGSDTTTEAGADSDSTEASDEPVTPETNPDGSLASVAGQPCVDADLSEAGPLGAEIDFPAGEPPTELVVEDVEEGTGEEAALGDSITVNYHGVSCSTGEVFDSSFARGEPATFGLVEGGLIEGWTEGIPGMKVGGTRLLVIPPELGYGEQGNQGIAPDETLVFVVELVDVGWHAAPVDFDDDPREAAFRAEVRAWLDSVATLRDRDQHRRELRPKTHDDDLAHLEEARAWQKVLVDAGYAAVHWPVEHGGRGLPVSMAVVVEQEKARYDVPQSAFMVGIDMAGPTLMAHASPEQQAAWLPGTLTGEHHWCQLFSEPDAGSDLASLATTAVLDGDEWVISGQKVWTSQAHVAQLGMLLARTDPDAPRRHDGISFFVLDMDSPGVTVRPLRQIDGAVHFNEVFLDEVRVPAAHLVGPPHGGWSVARTTLTSERSAIGGGGGVSVEEMVELARRLGALDDPTLRQELARLHTRAEIQRWLGYRLRTAVAQGRQPGAEASVLKLLNSHMVTHVGDLGLALQGGAATLWGGAAVDDGFWQDAFLFQWSSRIGGGTEQIQRNIIAERVLGLPRDPRP